LIARTVQVASYCSTNGKRHCPTALIWHLLSGNKHTETLNSDKLLEELLPVLPRIRCFCGTGHKLRHPVCQLSWVSSCQSIALVSQPLLK
jgi:hypothetical protein